MADYACITIIDKILPFGKDFSDSFFARKERIAEFILLTSVIIVLLTGFKHQNFSFIKNSLQIDFNLQCVIIFKIRVS